MSSGDSNGNPSGEGVGSPTARVPSSRFAGEAADVSGEMKSGNIYFEDAEKAVFFAPWKEGTTGMRA